MCEGRLFAGKKSRLLADGELVQRTPSRCLVEHRLIGKMRTTSSRARVFLDVPYGYSGPTRKERPQNSCGRIETFSWPATASARSGASDNWDYVNLRRAASGQAPWNSQSISADEGFERVRKKMNHEPPRPTWSLSATKRPNAEREFCRALLTFAARTRNRRARRGGEKYFNAYQEAAPDLRPPPCFFSSSTATTGSSIVFAFSSAARAFAAARHLFFCESPQRREQA